MYHTFSSAVVWPVTIKYSILVVVLGCVRCVETWGDFGWGDFLDI
jgi:hypothetical protein